MGMAWGALGQVGAKVGSRVGCSQGKSFRGVSLDFAS